MTEQDFLIEQLERIGVQIRIAHFTGDSSYPTEYTLRYSFVVAMGPTLDMAVSAFIEKLLKYVPVEQAGTHGGECVECGRTVTALNDAGVCEGCVREAML